MPVSEDQAVAAYLRGRSAQTVAVDKDLRYCGGWQDFCRRRRVTLAEATPPVALAFLGEYGKTHSRREMALVPGVLRRLHEYLIAAGTATGPNPFGPPPPNAKGRGLPLPPLPSAVEPPAADCALTGPGPAIEPASVYPPRAPQPVAIVRDLSREYAQLAVFANGHAADLWVTAATFELRLTLSPAQVALLARDAVGVALAPVENADLAECWKPAVADRDPKPVDAAYRALMAAVERYHEAATGRRDVAAN